MPNEAENPRELLRHTLATVAYRARKPLDDAPPEFSGFRLSPGSRSAGEILAHLGDLYDWGLTLAQGKQVWNPIAPTTWDQDVARFYAALGALDAYLASDAPLARPAERIFQGPVADSLTHIGQISLMRRLAGAPVRGENYATAEISVGRVGASQTAPRVEFD
jgi:hypothetical protein